MIYERMVEVCSALRSGKYTQTKSCLRDEKGFCCLGVMCDLKDSAAWVSEVPEGWRKRYGYGAIAESNTLPDGVAEYLGTKNRSPSIPTRVPDGRGQHYTLAGLNDGSYLHEVHIPTDKGPVVLSVRQAATFNQIADIIETYWESL